jgi:hypothetical protein
MLIRSAFVDICIWRVFNLPFCTSPCKKNSSADGKILCGMRKGNDEECFEVFLKLDTISRQRICNLAPGILPICTVLLM